MKLVLIGCEYTGTTTLALGLNEWAEKTIGSGFRIIHDHWKLPHTSGHLPTDTAHFLDADEQAQVLALSPKLKEMTQRHSLYYHTPSAPDDENRLTLSGEMKRLILILKVVLCYPLLLLAARLVPPTRTWTSQHLHLL